MCVQLYNICLDIVLYQILLFLYLLFIKHCKKNISIVMSVIIVGIIHILTPSTLFSSIYYKHFDHKDKNNNIVKCNIYVISAGFQPVKVKTIK